MAKSSNESKVVDGTPLTPSRYGRSIGKTSSFHEQDPEQPIYTIGGTIGGTFGETFGKNNDDGKKTAHNKPMDIRKILKQQQRKISVNGSKGAGNYQDTSDVGAPNDEQGQ